MFLFSFFICLLSGCENKPAKQAAKPAVPHYAWGEISGQTIRVRGNAADLRRPYIADAFERYRQVTGNSIVLEEFTHQELESNLPAAFIDGREEKPDVLLSFGGTNLEKLDPAQNFYDFTAAPWVDDLTDTALNQAIYQGRVMGLPYGEMSVSGTLYNKEIFKRLDIALPRTQAEFLEACEKLLQHGITPVYLPYAEPTMLLYQFPMDSLVRDNRTLEALNEGRLSYAQMPGMHKIIAWYRTMSDRGYFGQNYSDNGWDGMDAALSSGKYAMMLCWDTWLYTNFTGEPEKFGLLPAFMGEPEQGTYEGANMALLLVNKQSPRLDAALDMITFIADPYNYNVALRNMRTAPGFKNQAGSLLTPQYAETERRIEKLFHDSTAWLRIRGFSQRDAIYIQKHMKNPGYSVEDCLKDMDAARLKRAQNARQTDG